LNRLAATVSKLPSPLQSQGRWEQEEEGASNAKSSNKLFHPSDAAFLALSHLKLGNLDEAKMYRGFFDEAIKDERFSKDEDNLNFQKEVNKAFAELQP
jgi:hypothetical protein